MRRFGAKFFVVAALLAGMGLVCASAQSVDAEKRFPQKSVELKTCVGSDGKSVPMFRDAGKKASIAVKSKVRFVSSEKKFALRQTGKADEFNPRVIGANKISMQKFNRYAYRKSNSAKPGVPIKTAGARSDSDETN